MMATRKWMDNAFWHNEEKEMAEAILVITDDNNREITQVVTVRKFDINGDLNTDFQELMAEVGEEKIDENTKERQERKSKEKEIEEQRKKAEEQARELEKLFDAKIKILEIDAIKNTSNKSLKSKLRRSKNQVELNLYAQLIMMEELGLGFVLNDSEKTE
jgi:thiamine pyrophosphate-dependent acetolactate synthase large subunit-like protein